MPCLLAVGALAGDSRYNASNCTNHNAPGLVEIAKPPIANSLTVCSKIPERFKFYQQFFVGGGDREAMDKRINDLAAKANDATAAYVAKAAQVASQKDATDSVNDLLAKMRAAKADLDKLSAEMQTVGKQIIDDRAKVAAKHAVLQAPRDKALKDFATVKQNVDQIQQAIARNMQQKQQMVDFINKNASDSNAARAVETQKQRVSQLQGVIDQQNQGRAKLEKEGIELSKAREQLAAADTDVIKDVNAYQQVLKDWESEMKKLRIVANRITYADPGSSKEAKEAAKTDLALAHSSVIGPDGKPLAPPDVAPGSGASAAAGGASRTSVEQEIQKLTAGSEQGGMYQGVFESKRGDIESGKAEQKEFAGDNLAQKSLLNDKQNMVSNLNSSSELLNDDKKLSQVPKNIQDAVDEAHKAYADLTKGDIKGVEKTPEEGSGIMAHIIPSYKPAPEFEERVNKDIKDYNDAMAKLSPEEQAYAARLGVPSHLSNEDLAYTTFYSQHSSDTVNTEASATKGWYTWARDGVVGGAKELYQDATGQRDNSIRDTGIFDMYRNNVAMLGKEGQEAGFSHMVLEEQKSQTLMATGDSSTYSGWDKFTHVTAPTLAEKIMPTSVADALDFHGTNTIDQQLERTQKADAIAAQSGLAADAEYARDIRSSIVRSHFASTGEVTANSAADSIELKRDTTIKAGTFNDESDWRWGERKAFWREMVLSSVAGPAGQAIVAQDDTNKATLLRAYANTYQTSELIDAANKAQTTAENSRNAVFIAGAMTATGQTVISGAAMKAAKATYMEVTTAAMLARESRAVVRDGEAVARYSEHFDSSATRDFARKNDGGGNAGGGFERPESGVGSRIDGGNNGVYIARDDGFHGTRATDPSPHTDDFASGSRGASATGDFVEHTHAPPVATAERGAAPAGNSFAVAEDAGAPAGRSFASNSDHAASQSERLALAERYAGAGERSAVSAERTAVPAERAAVAVEHGAASGASRALNSAEKFSGESARAAAAGESHGVTAAEAVSGAHSAAVSGKDGADQVAAAIREGAASASKVAEPTANVSSSSFLARVAESVGWSGSREATGASQAVSAAALEAKAVPNVARQGERGVQELEHLASSGSQGGRELASVSHAPESAAVRQTREASALASAMNHADEAAKEAVASEEAAARGENVAANAISEDSKAAAHDTGKAQTVAADTERAGKEMAEAAKDEAAAPGEKITPRTFAAEAEKMMKPGSKPDRYLDHIANLSAIKAAAKKDEAYLQRLAKAEGVTPDAYMRKLDRRINYFEHQLHERYAFPKDYMEQYKEVLAHGGLDAQETADVKRLLTQRAVLETGVAKTMVDNAAKKITKAMDEAFKGGDRGALEAALKKAKVPETLAQRVGEAFDVAKKGGRLNDAELRAAMPAISRDLAGAAVLTQKAPQVGHNMWENLAMMFKPSNGAIVGLGAGMAKTYVTNPVVRAARWIGERPNWFRGVPKYAVKDFTQMELEARLTEASLKSGEKLTADVRRMARVALETEEADKRAKDALAAQEATAKAERDAAHAAGHCVAGDEIACSPRYLGTMLNENIYNRVQQIAPETKLDSLLRDPVHFSREAFYKAAAETVDIRSYVEAQGIDKYNVYPRLNGALEKLGAPFRALLLDPGVITHGNELVDFIEKSPSAWKNPWELRKAFSDELGKVKVYRGMALTADDAERIKKGGLVPAGLRDDHFGGVVRSLGIPHEAMLKRHMLGQTAESLFSSFTIDSPELGIAMANQALPHVLEKNPGAAVYMMEAEVNKLDLVHYTADGIPASPSYSDLMRDKVGITYDGKPHSLSRGGPAQESLMYLPVSPDQITSIKKVEDGAKYGYVMPKELAEQAGKWDNLPGSSPLLGEEFSKLSMAEKPFAEVASETGRASEGGGMLAAAEKVQGPLVADAAKSAPAGSLLAKSQELGAKIEGSVRALLESGHETDLARRQLKIENAVRALVTEDRIPRAEVEKLRSLVEGGKIPELSAADVSARARDLAQARYLTDAAVAPKLRQAERDFASAIKAGKKGDTSALEKLGIDAEHAKSLLEVEKEHPGMLVGQGVLRNLAESQVLSRDAGEALTKNRFLNSYDRLRRFATGSAQLSAALAVGGAHGLWSGAKWAAGFAKPKNVKEYWSYKLAGYGYDTVKNEGEVRWTASSLKALAKQEHAAEAQATAYWMLVGAADKTDAASNVAREAALKALHDSGLSPEAVKLVHAQALTKAEEPIGLVGVPKARTLDDVLRKKDLQPAAEQVFFRTAGYTDPASVAARSSAVKALTDSGFAREEIDEMLHDAQLERDVRQSVAKTAVQAYIEFAIEGTPETKAMVDAADRTLAEVGVSATAISGLRGLVEADSAQMRQMLQGSDRVKLVTRKTLRDPSVTKGYEALLVPTKRLSPAEEKAAVDRMFAKLASEPALDFSSAKSVEQRLKLLEEGSDGNVVTSTDGIYVRQKAKEGTAESKILGGVDRLVREYGVEGVVDRTADGKIRFRTAESAKNEGQLTAQAMVAHEKIHVDTFKAVDQLRELQAKYDAATGAAKAAAGEALAAASSRSISLSRGSDAAAVLDRLYVDRFSTDEVLAHLEQARNEAAQARLLLTTGGSRESLLRAAASLNLSRDALARAEELRGASRVHLGNVADALKANPGGVEYDSSNGVAKLNVPSGEGFVTMEMYLAHGLSKEEANRQFAAATDHALRELDNANVTSRTYLAKETARLQDRLDRGDFGKMGGGAYADAKPTTVRGTRMYTAAALQNAPPAVREASLLRDARDAAAADRRRNLLAKSKNPAERIPLLAAEEDYLARLSAVARDEDRALKTPESAARAADLERKHAGVAAQLLGERSARERQLGANGREAAKGFVKSLDTDALAPYADHFAGQTLDQVFADPAKAELFHALRERDLALDAKYAREARESLAGAIEKHLPGVEDTARAEKMAADLAEAHSLPVDAVNREKLVGDKLAERGWTPEQVSSCMAEGLCAPKLEARPAAVRDAEASEMARGLIFDDEMSRATGKAVEEARDLAKEPKAAAKSFEETIKDLRTQGDELAKEAAAKKAALAASPDDAAIKAGLDDVTRAQKAVDDKIAKLSASEAALKAATVSAADVDLEKLAARSVVDFLRNPPKKLLSSIDPRLADEKLLSLVSAGRYGPDNAYVEFKKVVGSLELSKRVEVFQAVESSIQKGDGRFAQQLRAAPHAGAPVFTSAARRGDEIAGASHNPNLAHAAVAAEMKSKEELALAETVGAVKGHEGPVATEASLRAEKAAVEAETKALVSSEARKVKAEEAKAARAPASVAQETPKDIASRGLARIAGLDEKARASLADSMAALEASKDAVASRVQRMNALAGNPDLFETYRMAYQGAASAYHDAEASGKSISREKAWDLGVRKMLEDSGYSKAEIDAGLLRKTEVCLTL